MRSTVKYVIQHPTDGSLLRKPRWPGDTVHWTQEEPISARVPWTFATRSGAEKTRNMVAHEATVELWEEPTAYSTVATPTPQYNSGMQDYMLAAVLADLLIVSSDSGGC